MSAQPHDDFDLYDLPSIDYDAQPPTVDRAPEAEMHLKQLARIERERVAIRQRLQDEIERLEARATHILEPLARRALWHEQGLQAFLWSTGLKTWKGLFGTLKRRKSPVRVEVVDETAYVAWARTFPPDLQEKLLRMKIEVPKMAVKEYWESTGVVPPGTEVRDDEPDRFGVELSR